ncbi:MAG: phosphate/phosphite/phosphonate ABC transporter substrate-binding protein, partial [Halomonas sp.]
MQTTSLNQVFHLRSLLSVAIAGVFTVTALQASADMSSRYNDNDGDMVADIPADESQWVDPDTLIFAYTP